jgi:hypothetical protein
LHPLGSTKKGIGILFVYDLINIPRIAAAGHELVALTMPEGFHGVGDWYQDFSQTRDGEISEGPSHEDL